MDEHSVEYVMPRWRAMPVVLMTLGVIAWGLWYMSQEGMVHFGRRGGLMPGWMAGSIILTISPIFCTVALMSLVKPARFVVDWNGLSITGLNHTLDFGWHEIERVGEKRSLLGFYRVYLTLESIEQRGEAFKAGIEIPAAAEDLVQEVRAWLADRAPR